MADHVAWPCGLRIPLWFRFSAISSSDIPFSSIRLILPEAVRVGTVDKFQGQQAPVVFYSITSSSGTEIPRGLEFLLSRNRLNVAISRAQCLAYLVGNPRLLDVRCHTVEQMRMANALCRAVEMAAGQRTLLTADPRGDPESMPLSTNE